MKKVEAMKFKCPDCDVVRTFEVRIEGDLRTGEEFEVVYCDACGWERERKLVPSLFAPLPPQ